MNKYSSLSVVYLTNRQYMSVRLLPSSESVPSAVQAEIARRDEKIRELRSQVHQLRGRVEFTEHGLKALKDFLESFKHMAGQRVAELQAY